ncbi:leucine-rich repeat protein [Acetobacterium fimetarium]|uniref:Leucine-rich repeat protein n=1 Tax=Acetobacterium fimetarium TaxID=52691 RepID=A0ABR6WWT7_9FIRM|nr:leucine-rich repeat protein [Acetobacterium fimetarium]MBC3805055.1 leucine-rich repeat protein [Acetobacterium fimetarium]
MKNEFKKTLSLMMVFLFTISMMPAGVFAENVQPDPTIGAVASVPVEEKVTMDLSVKTDTVSAENPATEKTAAETPSSVDQKINLPQLDNPASVISDTAVPETVQTEAVSGEFTYEVIAGGVAITKYNGSANDVTIPDTIDGKPVIEVRSGFSKNSLTSLILGNNVKTFRAVSYGYTWVERIVVPEATTQIDSACLYSGNALKVIGKKGSYAETYVANNSNSAVFIDMDLQVNGFYGEETPGGIKIVDYNGSETNLTIPSAIAGKPVVSIGLKTFSKNTNITEVVIPDSVTNFEESSTLYYWDGIFASCKSLVKLTFGKGITKIPANVAMSCSNLEEVVFNGNVVSIGNNAFDQCAKLQALKLPESLETIGNNAFSGCAKLQTLKLPESLETIGNNAFFRCNSMTSLTIPDKTTTIGSGAFVYCDKLENLVLGNSLTTLDNRAFEYCSSLKEVTLPKSLTTINAGNVFTGCLSLSKVVIPNTTTSITSNIFDQSPLTTIYGSNGSYAQTFAEKYGIPFVPVQATSAIDVLYQTHVQNYGWQDWKKNGEMSGTSHEALRLEAINIKLDQQKYDLSVNYATHVQNYGWQDWKKNGEMSGTSHESLRLEAIRINLSGADADKFDIYYHVHAQNVGWMGWAKNGADAGTAGFAYRLEAIEILILPKDSPAPGSTENPFQENK